MMNYMKEVAALLGVEFEEIFKIKKDKTPDGQLHMKDKEYKLTPKGLYMSYDFGEVPGWMKASESFTNVLNGNYTIVKLPWTPKEGETYYYCKLDEVDCTKYTARHSDKLNIKLGNCFRTDTEAEEHLDRFMEFIKSEPITDWRDNEHELQT